jgi:serine/threonine protein kinase
MSEQIRAESTNSKLNRLLAGKYEVIEEISRGAFGRILKVRQTGLDKVFAAKVLADDPSNQEAFRRLAREGQILTRLSHPNIVKVYSAAVDKSAGFIIIMDYLDGVPLSQLIRDKQLNIDLTVDLFKQMCAGLSYAHENGILHRDLKPSNVMVTTVDARREAVLIDFGIAKVQDANQKLTQTGALLGTPLYMSPEQLAGDALDLRSDVYSLGCVLYEMLTGVPPFSGETWMELAAQHHAAPVRPPSERCSTVPGDLEDIVLKCMAKKPEDRYQSMASLSETLDSATFKVPPRKTSMSTKSLKINSPVKRAIAAFGGAVFMAVIGLGALQLYKQHIGLEDVTRLVELRGQENEINKLIDGNQLPIAEKKLGQLIENVDRQSKENEQSPIAGELPKLYVMLAKVRRLQGDYSDTGKGALHYIDEAEWFKDRFELPSEIPIEKGMALFGADKFAQAIRVLDVDTNGIRDPETRLNAFRWRAKAFFFKPEEEAGERWRRYSDASSEAIKVQMHYAYEKNWALMSKIELRNCMESCIICALVLDRQRNFTPFGARGEHWGANGFIEWAGFAIKNLGPENTPALWLAAREEAVAELVAGTGQPEGIDKHVAQMEQYLAQVPPPANAFEEHENKLWIAYLRNRVKERPWR